MGHPQWIYHRTEEPRIIDSDDLAIYTGEGWATTPAAFRQSKKERELRARLAALEKEAVSVMEEINRLRNDEAEKEAASDDAGNNAGSGTGNGTGNNAPRPARRRKNQS